MTREESICRYLDGKGKWHRSMCSFCTRIKQVKCVFLDEVNIREANELVPAGFVDKTKFPEREGYLPGK